MKDGFEWYDSLGRKCYTDDYILSMDSSAICINKICYGRLDMSDPTSYSYYQKKVKKSILITDINKYNIHSTYIAYGKDREDSSELDLLHNEVKLGDLVFYYNSKFNCVELGLVIGKNTILTLEGKKKKTLSYIPCYEICDVITEKKELLVQISNSLGIFSGNKARKTIPGSLVLHKTGIYLYLGDYNLSLETNLRIKLSNEFIGKKSIFVRLGDNLEEVQKRYSYPTVNMSSLIFYIQSGDLKLGESYTSEYALQNLLSMQNKVDGFGGYGNEIDEVSFGALYSFNKVSTLNQSIDIINDITLDVISFYNYLVVVRFTS